jgi:predicted ATP-dependent serine protease
MKKKTKNVCSDCGKKKTNSYLRCDECNEIIQGAIMSDIRGMAKVALKSGMSVEISTI